VNAIVQHDQVVHIVSNPQKYYIDQQIWVTMLEQMIDVDYENAELVIEKDKYGTITHTYVVFDSIEDATHFRLKYMS